MAKPGVDIYIETPN